MIEKFILDRQLVQIFFMKSYTSPLKGYIIEFNSNPSYIVLEELDGNTVIIPFESILLIETTKLPINLKEDKG